MRAPAMMGVVVTFSCIQKPSGWASISAAKAAVMRRGNLSWRERALLPRAAKEKRGHQQGAGRHIGAAARMHRQVAFAALQPGQRLQRGRGNRFRRESTQQGETPEIAAAQDVHASVAFAEHMDRRVLQGVILPEAHDK